MAFSFVGLYNENMNSRTEIIATIGHSSESVENLTLMVESGMDMARLNFSWGDFDEKKRIIENIRIVEKNLNKKIYIIQDLPGPRIQTGKTHTYDKNILSSLTDEDKKAILFGIDQEIDFIALSFVGSALDIEKCREFLKDNKGRQYIIAKIERKEAVDNLEEIVKASDAVMVARGDLGHEFPIEEIPFIQQDIIKKCKTFGKPVVVATEMLLSMTEKNEPTRAEVTDVSVAVSQGADAVMLSEETAAGKYPVESVAVMNKIIKESESHMPMTVNLFTEIGKKKENGKLVIVRHQESEWNKEGLWTGSRDIHLTELGFERSKEMGTLIKDFCFDAAFASMQVRSIETLASMISVCMSDTAIPTEHAAELNERDYGDYTGKNKWEMEELMEEKEFNEVRRGWDKSIPNGESLKMVYDRAVPFFLGRVMPLINQGKNVLLVSHGNTIRSLMKYIENIGDKDIENVEMLFDSIMIYNLDSEGHMINKEVRSLRK